MNNPQIEVKYKKTRYPVLSKEMLAELYEIKEKLEDFIEEMEILSDHELVAELDESIEEVKKGNVVRYDSLEDFKKDLYNEEE